MTQDRQEYVLGQRVTGSIERVLPYGVFVRLDDGARAYIRRRELTWAGYIDPRTLWREGEKVDGVVSKLPIVGQCMELSVRDVLPDPWNEFVASYSKGDVVEGTVKGLIKSGVFVEVVPGVDGLIPLQDLATWEVHRPEDMVWVGDAVEAVITHLDRQSKKLRLSIRARLRQMQTVAGVLEQLNVPLQSAIEASEPADVGIGEGGFDHSAPCSSTELLVEPLVVKQVGRILVVDDHYEVRLPLVEWLRHRGFEVDHAQDAEDAYEKFLIDAYGLLFVDLNLPGADGLAFLRKARQKRSNYRVVVMSSPEWLADLGHQIETFGVVDALAKPLDLAEIEQLLLRIGGGETLPRWQMVSRPARTRVPKSFQQMADALSTRISLAQQLRAGLKQLVATTPAEVGIIFYLDPLSRRVSMTAQVGADGLNNEAIRGLGSSPVRDVTEDGEHILENRMTGQVRERFAKLLDLLSFESCIGIPIEAHGKTYRALFLLHRKSGVFNRYHLRDTLAAGALFSVAIERQAMEQRFRELNKLLLSGQLARGLSHEVYNKMSGLEIQLRNLETDCRAFSGQTPRSVDFDGFEEIQLATDRLLETCDDLKRTVELFQHLMRTAEVEAVNINEVVRKTTLLLQPLMREQKIGLETDLQPGLPGIVGSAVQLQQVFLNIILNGVQQMVLQPGGVRILNLTTFFEESDEDRPLKIRIADTGPGIHQRLWEKIFDLGFTTRPGGTGQGLYLARSLIQSLGGRVFVERSAILVGTTFLIELPDYVLGEEGDEVTTTSVAGRR